MLRKWTREEVRELLMIFDRAYDQAVTQSPEIADMAVQHFNSSTEPFLKVQITNKITSLARGINLQNGHELLHNWKHYRLQLFEKYSTTATGGDGKEQADGDHSQRLLKRKRKTPCRKDTGFSSAGEDQEDLENVSKTLSEPESDLTSEGELEEQLGAAEGAVARTPLEIPSSTSPMQRAAPTILLHGPQISRKRSSDRVRASDSSPSISVFPDSAEQELLKCVRELHGSWHPNPSDDFVEHALDKIFEKLAAAIHCFQNATATTALKVPRLTADARELSGKLFNSTVGRGADLEHFLQALFDDPALTTDQILHVYAALAVTEWVFQRFDAEVPKELKVVYYTLNEHAPNFARGLAIQDKLKHLETKVKPSLPRLAENFQVKLFDIFHSLREASPAPEGRSAGLTTMDRADQLSGWKDKANQAFGDALDLRLRMEQSVCPYTFRWVFLGELFDKSWMESGHKDKNSPSEDNQVLVCLRPAIYSCSRRPGSEPLIVVRALVMLEGSGAPCEVKTDYGSIR